MLERSYQNGHGGLTFTSSSLKIKFNHNFIKLKFYFIQDSVDCDCGVAWLIRDNRHLLKSVEGTCLNNSISTKFQDLDWNNYTNCTDIPYSSDDDGENKSWLYFLLLKLVGVGI